MILFILSTPESRRSCPLPAEYGPVVNGDVVSRFDGAEHGRRRIDAEIGQFDRMGTGASHLRILYGAGCLKVDIPGIAGDRQLAVGSDVILSFFSSMFCTLPISERMWGYSSVLRAL